MAIKENWEEHRFEVTRECRYLLQIPDSVSESTLMVIALHGYGQNPQVMLQYTQMVVGKDKLIASIAAPNEQFLDPNPATSSVGYNWGTRNHWPEAIRLHTAMVETVRQQLQSRFSISPARTILMGYSQPVGLNYRFLGTHPESVGGLIAICGGVPKDWEEPDKYQTVNVPILHIARDQDEFFPVSVSSEFEQRLKVHATDVTFCMMEGPHRFPSKAGTLIEPWIERVFK